MKSKSEVLTSYCSHILGYIGETCGLPDSAAHGTESRVEVLKLLRSQGPCNAKKRLPET